MLYIIEQEDEDGELKALITSFKNMTGLWDIDPEDSAWFHLEQKDKNDPSIVIPMGSICYRYSTVRHTAVQYSKLLSIFYGCFFCFLSEVRLFVCGFWSTL